MLDAFPDTAAVADGELTLGGVRVAELARRYGTPLLVYCRESIRTRARACGAALGPGPGFVAYGTKAFPNVAVMRLLAESGLGADVSTLGELEFARRAGVDGGRIVFHGNNKSDTEVRAATGAGALLAVDAADDVERLVGAGERPRAIVRVTPGIDALTHRSIRTAHAESKFGLAPADALAAICALLREGVEVAGLHVHIGSQLARSDETVAAVDVLADVADRASRELGWFPTIIDVGGGLGVRHSRDECVPSVEAFARRVVDRVRARLGERVALVLEPGRSLVGEAGVTLYTVGVVKRSGGITYVSVDGGMSDNPRPQLYGARYEAVVANRADAKPTGEYRVAGKHCESGDVLIEAAALSDPRRGDVLAVPATGAYTLALASNYNGVPRPAAVLVAEGNAQLIRRRETIDDLLALEVA